MAQISKRNGSTAFESGVSSEICSTCPIRVGCDVFSIMCKLTPREVVEHRKIKLRTQPPELRLANKVRSGIAALGMKKYDRRRKPDTLQRMIWRIAKRGVI